MTKNDPTDFRNVQGLLRAIRSAQAHLRPPPDLKPSEWAEENVRIPIGNAIPGLIRFDNAPYQREPIDMTMDPSCYRVTLQWGAQVGKTTVALCAQGYRIAQNPTSQMMMQPSEGDLKTWLETKFNPLVDENAVLSNLLATPRGREGVNNQKMKSYPGGFIMFSWSGSPKTMRGRSAPFIVCDETDGYDRTNEGHPVSLLWQRAATFGDQRSLLEISTPIFKDTSHIENSFENGDKRRFFVACPHCGTHQHLEWEYVVWDKSEDGEHLPETAAYACRDCGVHWNDGERIAAIRVAESRGGGWRAEKPFKGHASYHLNELYSCFRKLRDIVQSFLEKKSSGDLQTFINVSLAQTWEEPSEKLESQALMGRACAFPAQVPARGVCLTAGIDMQEDRLEVETVAWGLGEESWSVDYKVLWGDPLHPDVWADLDDYLAQSFAHESGAELPISGACLDTGGSKGYTQAAYDYAKGKTGRRLFAVKGAGGWGMPIVSAPSRKRTGRGQRKVDLFIVGADEAKLVVMRRLQLEAPGPGYCHFPDTRDPEWFNQLTAERLKLKYIRGVPIREWHQTRDRNEALDCRVYATAALKIINPNLKKLSDRLSSDDLYPVPGDTSQRKKAPEKAPAEEKPPTSETGASRKSTRKRRAKKRGGSWSTNW